MSRFAPSTFHWTQLGQLLHGGWGYAEYPISRYVVDEVLPIFEGVKPILEVVARSLFSR